MSKVDQQVQQNVERLNTDCACITLDRAALFSAMEEAVGDPAFCRELALSQPNLLSAQPMFLSASHADRMQQIVSAIEMVVSLADYQSAVLAQAPGRHRDLQHLGNRPGIDAEPLRRRPLASPLDQNRVSDPRIQIHWLHPAPPADAGTRALSAALLVRRSQTNQPRHCSSIAPAVTRTRNGQPLHQIR